MHLFLCLPYKGNLRWLPHTYTWIMWIPPCLAYQWCLWARIRLIYSNPENSGDSSGGLCTDICGCLRVNNLRPLYHTFVPLSSLWLQLFCYNSCIESKERNRPVVNLLLHLKLSISEGNSDKTKLRYNPFLSSFTWQLYNIPPNSMTHELFCTFRGKE